MVRMLAKNTSCIKVLTVVATSRLPVPGFLVLSSSYCFVSDSYTFNIRIRIISRSKTPNSSFKSKLSTSSLRAFEPQAYTQT